MGFTKHFLLALAGFTSTAAIIAAAPACAQAQAVDIAIERQPLGAALNRLSAQADIIIIAPTELVAGKTAPDVRFKGDFNEALTAMLDGSGLEAHTEQSPSIAPTGEDGAQSRTVIIRTAARELQPVQFSIAESEDAPTLETDTIFVTGSRIARSSFSAPVPLQVIDAEAIRQSGFNEIDELLLQNPAFAQGLGSANTLNNNDAGAAFANLRGLGANRTLVLVNGRRRVSGASQSSAVDLNTIPASLIERVEVVTGGASAVYGADAVSGLVNIITKTDFEGLEFSVNGGIADEGDAETFSVSMHGGTKFAEDRGHLNFSISYADRAELRAVDREYGEVWNFQTTNFNNTGPNDGIPDQLTYRDIRGPYNTPDVNFFVDDTYYVYDSSGLRPVNVGETLFGGRTGLAIGGEGATFREHLLLRAPLETFSARSDLSYELTDTVEFFAEAELAATNSAANEQFYRFDSRSIWFNGNGGPVIQRDNPFLPQEVADLMTANGLTELPARRRILDEFGGEPVRIEHNRNTFTLVGGFKGVLFDRFDWELSQQYGRYEDSIQTRNLLIASNFLNAVDVIADPASGDPVCRSELARAQGCVPYNIFERKGSFSAAEQDYFVHTRLQNVKNTQSVTSLQASGPAFDLPAGPVSFAAGLEYREETLDTRDDGLSLSGETTFLRQSPRPAIDAGFDVVEGYFETLAPILANTRLAKELSLEGAVRISDYSSIGTTTAWRFAANWALDDNFRFRFTRSRSVRAPNLFELFEQRSEQPIVEVIPCRDGEVATTENRLRNCRSIGVPEGFNPLVVPTAGLQVSGGNDSLSEETSNSLTVGTVITPGFIPGLSLSVDYFDIKITDAVSRFSRVDILERCFDSSSLDNQFCDRITVADDFSVARVDISNINVGSLDVKGIDLFAEYSFPLEFFGDVGLTFAGAYLLEKEQFVVPSDPTSLIIQDGEYTDPTLRFNIGAAVQRDDWRYSIRGRFVGESDIDRQAAPERFDIPTVDSRFYTDVTVGYALRENVDLSLTINNLFDVEPPFSAQTYLGGTGSTGPGATAYDNIGRFIAGRIDVRF